MIRSRTVVSVVLAAALSAAAIARGETTESVDFLVPGVSIGSVSFTAGARVTYLVTSEVDGDADSSLVGLAVLECRADDVLLEISSTSVPAAVDETVVVRLRLGRSVTAIRSPDEFRGCIREVLIREGEEPFREPTEEELDEFELERVLRRRSAEGETRALAPETLQTPAGDFSCTVTERSVRSVRRVELGGIDAERVEEETSTVWLASDVPLWGMVKSSVARTKRILLLIDSPRATLEPHTTVTAAILVAFEHGERSPAAR